MEISSPHPLLSCVLSSTSCPVASSRTEIADLNNQYDDDRVLRRYLERVLPASVWTEVAPGLRASTCSGFCWPRPTARRGLALARDLSQTHEVGGTPLLEKPLHYDTIASLPATFEGAFHDGC